VPARDYLVPTELDREAEFDALYRDVLKRMVRGGIVGPLDEFFADQVAGTLWKLKRAGADADQMFAEVVLQRRYAESRANELVEADVRGRIQALHRRNLEGLMMARTSLMSSFEPVQRKRFKARTEAQPLDWKVHKGGKA
jgi:hypothetical protein